MTTEEDVCQYQIANSDHFGRLDARMQIAEAAIQAIQQCVIRLTTLQDETKRQSEILEQTRRENQKDTEARFRALESANGKKFEKFSGYIVASFFGGIAVYLLNAVGLGS